MEEVSLLAYLRYKIGLSRSLGYFFKKSWFIYKEFLNKILFALDCIFKWNNEKKKSYCLF